MAHFDCICFVCSFMTLPWLYGMSCLFSPWCLHGYMACLVCFAWHLQGYTTFVVCFSPNASEAIWYLCCVFCLMPPRLYGIYCLLFVRLMPTWLYGLSCCLSSPKAPEAIWHWYYVCRLTPPKLYGICLIILAQRLQGYTACFIICLCLKPPRLYGIHVVCVA